MLHKGFGNIVLSVLLFLLGLLFIGVLGGYLLEAVHAGESSLNGAAACTFVQITPVLCEYANTSEGYDLRVQARREGSSTAVKTLHVLLMEEETQDIIRVSASMIPYISETSNVLVLKGVSQKYSSVALAPTLIDPLSGKDMTCAPSEMVECIKE